MQLCRSSRPNKYLRVLRLLVLCGRLGLIPAGVLRLHLPLLCPGQGSWGSRLRPVVARLLGQQLRLQYHVSCDYSADTESHRIYSQHASVGSS